MTMKQERNGFIVCVLVDISLISKSVFYLLPISTGKTSYSGFLTVNLSSTLRFLKCHSGHLQLSVTLPLHNRVLLSRTPHVKYLSPHLTFPHYTIWSTTKC